MRFRIAGNGLQGNAVARILVGFSIACLGIPVRDYMSGRASAREALFMLAWVILLPATAAIGFRWSRSGWMVLDDERLRVNRHFGLELYRWSDIDSLRVATFADHGAYYRVLALVCGVPLTRKFVEMHLRTDPKWGLGRSGSDVAGLPLPGRTVFLDAETPEDFVEAARALSLRAAS